MTGTPEPALSTRRPEPALSPRRPEPALSTRRPEPALSPRRPEPAVRILRRGVAASPQLRQGLAVTWAFGLSIAGGKLVLPVVIQRALDRPLRPDGGLDLAYIAALAAVGATLVAAAGFMSWFTQRRLVERAEGAIAQLRVDAFAQVHRLTLADHNETRRGVLVARVTSDCEALARFAQWGLYSWAINPVLILGTLATLAWYSWPLALVVAAVYTPVLPWFRWLQRRQLAAYDALRTRVGDMLGRFSEALMGAAVVRAYGAEQRTRAQLHQAIDGRYRARLRATAVTVTLFVTGDLIGAFAFAAVLVVGVTQRQRLGLAPGELVAALFLTNYLQGPVGELGETLDLTQTAVAGWRKILDLLDHPIDLAEPEPGVALPAGPLGVEVEAVTFAYRGADTVPVLQDVTVSIPAGCTVAVVGETGSGKTTFAKLLCRLADPGQGRILVGGVPLSEVAPAARNRAVRLVPQDGFLFDTTIRENVRFGAPGGAATDVDVEAAFTRLGLAWWVDRQPGGLDHRVGERGENLSVGERQLVALARAALADPGLLILDEATSAVDPETDQAINSALRVLARDRTLVSIAHRLATAEAADLILVFDEGRLVEQGTHRELVAAGGRYALLHKAWVGNTRPGGAGMGVGPRP